MPLALRPVREADRSAVRRFVRERWGSERMVAHDELFYPAEHKGFVAESEGTLAGLVTYRVDGPNCEITLIEAGERGVGMGTALLGAVEAAARTAGCHRLWLVTTNDNLDALRFYQRRGFVIRAVHPEAVNRARQLKPEIPHVGDFGIRIRDEIELEKLLPQEPAL